MDSPTSSSPVRLTEDELLAGAIPDIEQGIRAVLDETNFRLSEHVAEDVQEVIPSVVVGESDLDSDFEKAQENIRNLLTKGNKALNDLIILAGSSDNPRAYEVLTALINSLGQLNKDQIDLHAKKADVKTKIKKLETADGPTKQTVNNNLIVASPMEMIRMLRNSRKALPDSEDDDG